MKTERILTRWALIMAGGSGPILAGREGSDVYRTSTPLVFFDPVTLTGTTATGRPYRLVGNPDPAYALNAFRSLWDAGDAHVRVVSPAEAVALIAGRGNALFSRTLEEQADLDLRKLKFMEGQFRMQMTARGIDETEAARRSGLSTEQVRALLEGDAGGITANEADQAFVVLVESSPGIGGKP